MAGSSTRTWLWTAVATLGVIGLILVGLYVTGEPAFCASCHEMQPEVNGWRAGTHKEVSCFACHAAPGVVGYLRAHVGEGLHDLWVHFTRRPDKIVATTNAVPPSRCLACHSDAPQGDTPAFPKAPEFPDHPGKDASCPDCHRDQIHGPKP